MLGMHDEKSQWKGQSSNWSIACKRVYLKERLRSLRAFIWLNWLIFVLIRDSFTNCWSSNSIVSYRFILNPLSTLQSLSLMQNVLIVMFVWLLESIALFEPHFNRCWCCVVVQLSLLEEISVWSWWKVLVGAWALSDSHVSPRNQNRPKLGSFPRISQQRDGQWNSLNTLSLSTTKSLNNGIQQHYEKYSQYSKLANFTQTVLVIVYVGVK